MIIRRVIKTAGACAPAVLAAAILVAALPSNGALAADWLDDTLRGSISPGPTVRWDGINMGAGIGVLNMNTDLSRGLGPLTSRMLTNSTVLSESRPDEWDILENQTTNGRSYGAFIGYNYQWDSLVLGFDAGYNRTSGPATSASGTLRRVTATTDGTAHDLTISGTASTKLNDYATMRMRAGYAFGQFLPYAFLGGAVGRFDYSSTARLSDTQTSGGVTAPPYLAGPISESKNNAIVGGFVAGVGMDVALTSNIFVRGEYEFVAFAKLNGIYNTISTGRAALGVRF